MGQQYELKACQVANGWAGRHSKTGDLLKNPIVVEACDLQNFIDEFARLSPVSEVLVKRLKGGD